MLRILLIEDERESIERILELLDDRTAEIEYRHFDFDEGLQYINVWRPDIVILDLYEGNISEMNCRGSSYFDVIWKERFCPVVIHSAEPDIPEEMIGNSFVRLVTKGQNSPQEVLDSIDDFIPHIEAIQQAEAEIRNLFSIAMRDLAPALFDIFDNSEERHNAFRRAGRRRLAALIDDNSQDEQNLASWEAYIFPPVAEHILLGDVLREANGDSTDPTAFRLVLTPSCDLVESEGRTAKVEKALVAKCRSVKDGLQRTSLATLPRSKLKERLIASVLTQGYFETVIPLPQLIGRIPTMWADLRDLDLTPVSSIGLQDSQYIRVASLDSPFRELVAWAHVQVVGRPGLPDRDFRKWRDEILKAYDEQ